MSTITALELVRTRIWPTLKVIGLSFLALLFSSTIVVIIWAMCQSFYNATQVTDTMRQECQTKCKQEGFLVGEVSIPNNIVCRCSNTKTFDLETSP